MLSDNQWQRFRQNFPALCDSRISEKLIRSGAVVRNVDAGQVLYRDGDECAYLPMLFAGELALTKHAETGRAITLYRVGPGESCILSTLSILNRKVFPAQASTESAGTLALIPAAAVRELVAADAPWRNFVFATYHSRVAGLIALIEEVVFEKLDVRLAELLLRRSGGDSSTVRATHQELAVELGSSREVVSRVLKDWERRGVLELARGAVKVESPAGLRKITLLGD